MIGIIALSGIATRNAILLIDFVEERKKEGKPLVQSLLEAGRPADPADPADLAGGDAGGLADHAGPDLLRPGLVADLRPARLDALHAGRRAR